MAYNDIMGGDYLKETEFGWIHHWSMYAEQLTMYLLAAGSLDAELAKELYLGFERTVGVRRIAVRLHAPGESLCLPIFPCLV